MGVIASTLAAEQIAGTQQQAQAIANSATPTVQKGLAGMAWVDSNYDGKLDADAAKSPQEIGIRELNDTQNRFRQNGQLKLMASLDWMIDRIANLIDAGAANDRGVIWAA